MEWAVYTEPAGGARLILPAKVQTLVDELRRVLGLHPFDIDGFDINMDRDGIVQDVKPKMAFRRAREKANPVDKREAVRA